MKKEFIRPTTDGIVILPKTDAYRYGAVFPPKGRAERRYIPWKIAYLAYPRFARIVVFL